MRSRIAVTIPEATTADQLAAVASLASAIAAAKERAEMTATP